MNSKAAVDFDVIIVGGGLVGASMACALDGAGVSVAVIEQFAPDASAQPSFDERTIALTWSSRQILAGLGLWDGIAAAASPILDIHVSDRGHSGTCVLSHRDAGTAALGYVVPTRVLGRALHDRLSSIDSLTLFCPAEVADVRCRADRAEVQVRSAGESLARVMTGRMLILADGGRSAVGEQLGIRTNRKTYEQRALITTVRADQPHAGRAYERFVGSGPLAMLPLGERDYAVVWTLDADAVEPTRELSDERLLAKLQLTFGNQAGKFTDLGSRQVYPLSVARVSRPDAPRVVAIGNASHVVHPVAGQGFNLGLKDVADLAEQIRDRQHRGDDIGDVNAVRRYAKLRRRETRNVLNFTDGMIGVFTSDFPPFVVGRNLGLQAIDRLPSMRRLLLSRTMGLHGRQPRLLGGRPLRSDPGAPRRHYDIVIVGAGLAGGALACLLGNTRFRVALLDRAPPPDIPTGEFRLRINSYNRAAEKLLRDCGVWDRLPADRMYPFRRMRVCNAAGEGAVSFAAADVGETHLGHFIENDLVTALIMSQVEEFSNIDVVTDANIVDLTFEREQAVVQVAGSDAFAAQLLVGGDGANSRIREAAGIGVSRHPYHQRCIVGTVRFDGDLDETAWQRFLPTGPVGLLPLAPGHCSLAWSCDEAYAERLLGLDDEAFCAELDEAVAGRLGAITGIGQRASFPLVARDASTYVADRAALIGDAAHVIHPLAGLGANIGFQDVWALSRIILDAADDPAADIGAAWRLRRYERRRHRENQLVMSTMSVFNALFSNDNDALGRLRNGALRIADGVTPAKNYLMRRVMWMQMEASDE